LTEVVARNWDFAHERHDGAQVRQPSPGHARAAIEGHGPKLSKVTNENYYPDKLRGFYNNRRLQSKYQMQGETGIGYGRNWTPEEVDVTDDSAQAILGVL
jgi:hypothetical protein